MSTLLQAKVHQPLPASLQMPLALCVCACVCVCVRAVTGKSTQRECVTVKIRLSADK